MGLAGGVAFILVFLLFFLPLADFRVAKAGVSKVRKGPLLKTKKSCEFIERHRPDSSRSLRGR